MGNLICTSSSSLPENEKERIIQKYVEKIVSQTNIKAVPDAMERKMYNILFTVVLDLLEDTLQKSKIVIMDHEITFNIKPVEINVQQ